MRIPFFCFFLLINVLSYAQNTDYQILGKPFSELKKIPTSRLFETPRFLPLSMSSITSNTSRNTFIPVRKAFSISEQYYEHLGFFCKVELRLEQKNNFPIKFRLGEVQYVERMEGKYD